MATLTQSITEQLLEAATNPVQLEGILKEHSHSKGPLYIALAQATTTLTEQLATLSEKCRQTDTECQGRQQQLKTSDQNLADIGRAVEQKSKELVSLNERLEQNQALLNQADTLRGLGFGPDELTKLHSVLARTAASAGARPEEAVATFFQQVDDYQELVSLDLETKRSETRLGQARAEAERWEAEARCKETKAKARSATIDMVDGWLSHGIKEKDLPTWTRILHKVGISPDDLASALGSYGSLELMCQDLTQEIQNLQSQVKDAETRVQALREQEDRVKAGIAAIRDSALKEMRKIGNQAQQHLGTLLQSTQEYGQLQHQAALLAQEICLARAFTSNDQEQWVRVPRQTIQRLMLGLFWWTDHADRNRPVAPPHLILRGTTLTTYTRVPLASLVLWAYSGLQTEQEHKLLASGR
jgi:predicted  nucleic acid-binding Zn-ribbon protein